LDKKPGDENQILFFLMSLFISLVLDVKTAISFGSNCWPAIIFFTMRCSALGLILPVSMNLLQTPVV